MQPARHSRGRRALVQAALAGLMAMIVFALAQCTMVGDQLTNVEVLRHRTPSCIRACKDAFREARRAEKRLHKENLRACGVGDHDDRDDDDDGDDDGDGDDARVGDLDRGLGDGSDEAGLANEVVRRRGHDDDDDHGDDDDGGHEGDHERGKERSECVRAEERRHRAALDQIRAGLRECVRGCHHQGAGSAG